MKNYKVVSAIALSFLIASLVASEPTISLAQAPLLGGCQVFPGNNIWNVPVNNLPVDPNSNNYVNSIGLNTGMHADFGSGLWQGEPIGIPYVIVPAGQAKVNLNFGYSDESDPGPYPIPANAPIEGGAGSNGDRHVLVLEQGTCKLYETWSSYPQPNGSWQAGSGAVFDLNSNNLRPATWTSADAAGLPVLPGLVRRDEVVAGVINHALRFTIQRTRNSYIWPARHKASSDSNPNLPPMGQRFRLKANFDISSFPRDVQVILTALKTYGMFVADNGSNWYLSGAPDPTWDNNMLSQLGKVHGTDFEAINEAALQISANSGQAAVGPAAITALEGTPQGAVINSAFPATLKAKVTDILGNPASGVTVTFTAPSSGASGTFSGGGAIYAATDDAGGYITTPPFTSNGVAGTYDVLATVNGVTTPASFRLTNLTACSGSPAIVINSSDDGGGTTCGSLSRAILQAGPGTSITFSLSGVNPSLNVTGALPAVRRGVVLDGGSCSAGGPSLTLNGQNAPANTIGLVLQAGAGLKNIQVRKFPGRQLQFYGGGTTPNRESCVLVSRN